MSSQLPHDELEILIAADALDGLDPDERDRMARLMASHGPNCPECRRLVAEYGEVSGYLALLVDAVPMRAGAEDDLVSAARAVQAPLGKAGRPRPPVRRWVAIAAAAAALAVVAGLIGHSIAPGAPSLRSLALRGSVPARLTLVYQPGRADAVLVAAGLSDPGQGRVYEVWYQPSTGASMHPAGVFAPSNGFAVVSVSVSETFVLIAVTVEQGPRGSPQPTTNPILSASV